MNRLLLSLLFVLLLAFQVRAEDIHVDGTLGANCTTGNYSITNRNCTGSDGDAYQTIQGAFDDATLGADDEIIIRAGTYTAVSNLTVSGSVGSPITIRPFTGETPILRNSGASSNSTASIEITDASHVTISNLLFDGTGVQTSDAAILLSAVTANMIGITITGNSFDDWGGTGSNTSGTNVIRTNGVTSGGTATKTITTTISSNAFTNNSHSIIRISEGLNVLIENNTISSMRCGLFSDGRRGIQVIKDAQDSSGTIIRNNEVNGSGINGVACDNDSLVGTDDDLFVGLYCDTGAENGIIENNRVHNIDYPTFATVNSDSAGIFIESQCHNWTVRNNLVYDVGRKGIRLGSPSTGDPNDPKFFNNTIVRVKERCFHAFRGPRAVFQNNICHTESGGIVPFEGTATFITQGAHVISHNNLLEQGSTDVCRWGDTTNRTLASCQSVSGLFGSTLNTDPLLTSPSTGDLTHTVSTFENSGTAVSGVGCNAPACAIGAYEASIVPANNCVVGIVSALQLICTPENNRYPGLLASNFTTGWSVKKAGVDNPVTSVTEGGGILTINLTNAFAAGNACLDSYNSATGSLTDNAPSAFSFKQKMLSITDQTCSVQVGTGGAITFVAAGTAGNIVDNSSPAPGLPAGLATDDIIIAGLAGRDTNFTASISAGWTAILTPTQDTGRMLGLWYCFYPSCSVAPTWTIGSNNGEIVTQLAAYRGVSGTTPISEVTTPSLNITGNDIGPITGLSLAANNVVLVVGMKRRAWTSVTTLTGDSLTWIEIGEPDHDAGAGTVGLVWNHAINGASPVTVTSKTFDVVGGTDDTGKGVMFELNAGTTPPVVTRPDGASVLLTGAGK